MPNYMEHRIPMSTGFDLNAQRPLDHREYVQTYEDLINMPDIKKYIGLRVI